MTNKRRWFRFSLLSLVIFVSVCGSGYGVWVRWKPWAPHGKLPAHGGESLAANFSPDGKFVATSGRDSSVRIYDAATWQRINTFGHEEISIYWSLFSPDGKSIFPGVMDRQTVLWDSGSGQVRHKLPLTNDGACQSAAFSPNGGRLAVGTLEEVLVIWDVATGKRLHRWSLRPHDIQSMAWSPDGKRLAIGTRDSVCILDPETGAIGSTFKAPAGFHASYVTSWSPDGKQIAVGMSDGVVVYHAQTGEVLFRRVSVEAGSKGTGKGTWRGIGYTAAGDRLMAANWNESALIIDPRTCTVIQEIPRPKGYRGQAVISPDGNWLIFQSRSGYTVYRRNHPEWWHGVLQFKEFWLAAVLVLALLWSLRRDWKSFAAT